MSNKKFTIKQKEITKAKASDNKEYKIIIPEKATETKEKWEDGNEITIAGVKIIELDDKGKDTTTIKEDANATLIYKQGNLMHYFKVKEVDGKKFEEKEQKEVSTKGIIDSYRWTFWAMWVAIAILLGGFIWWWISSSRKEEKEEEGL